MRPPWVESGQPLLKTPRQKWNETKASWERSRDIEVPAPIPPAPPRPGGLRVAYLTYRGNPRCGGQGVYTRHLTRELVALGHSVEVFSGPPWPELDPGVGFTPVRREQGPHGFSIWQCFPIIRHTELGGRAGQPIEVARQERGLAAPGAQGFEEAQTMLERAVEHADRQGIVGHDPATDPDHEETSFRSITARSPRPLCRVSSYSPWGSESATIPPPTW